MWDGLENVAANSFHPGMYIPSNSELESISPPS